MWHFQEVIVFKHKFKNCTSFSLAFDSLFHRGYIFSLFLSKSSLCNSASSDSHGCPGKSMSWRDIARDRAVQFAQVAIPPCVVQRNRKWDWLRSAWPSAKSRRLRSARLLLLFLPLSCLEECTSSCFCCHRASFNALRHARAEFRAIPVHPGLGPTDISVSSACGVSDGSLARANELGNVA